MISMDFRYRDVVQVKALKSLGLYNNSWEWCRRVIEKVVSDDTKAVEYRNSFQPVLPVEVSNELIIVYDDIFIDSAWSDFRDGDGYRKATKSAYAYDGMGYKVYIASTDGCIEPYEPHGSYKAERIEDDEVFNEWCEDMYFIDSDEDMEHISDLEMACLLATIKF